MTVPVPAPKPIIFTPPSITEERVREIVREEIARERVERKARKRAKRG